MGKATKVTLVSDSLGEREFDITHAQAILDYERARNMSNWKLSPKGGFELHDGGIIKRANKGTGKKAQERPEADQGDPA